MSKTRVGVHTAPLIGWGGGIDFLCYLINGLLADTNNEVILLASTDSSTPTVNIDSPEKIKKPSPSLLRGASSLFKKRVEANIPEIENILKNTSQNLRVIMYESSEKSFLDAVQGNNLDIILPTIDPFGEFFPKPWVGYIWDFQHRYFPKLFDKENIQHRDNIFAKSIETAPAIIVNSKFVKDDAQKFYAHNKSVKKIIALPFAPFPDPSWLTESSSLVSKYSLPKRFILVSNQFWEHKDHLTALKAFKKIISDGPSDLHLVMTGKLEDSRSPKYIAAIKDLLEEKSMRSRVHYLGYIPKSDQIAVLRRSIAVIQPSLFEGGPGGGVAYNAVSLGVPLILSDIKINREVIGDRVAYFKANSVESLYSALINLAVQDYPKIPNRELIERGNKNKLSLAKTLQTVIDTSIKNHKGIR